jgi:hypothetical protein
LRLKDTLGVPRSAASARSLLGLYMTAQHHKTSGKHIGFPENVQACLNDVTSFLSELESGPASLTVSLVAGGKLDMQQLGNALVAITAECKLFAGCSPKSDGLLWFDTEGGWPADEDHKQE